MDLECYMSDDGHDVAQEGPAFPQALQPGVSREMDLWSDVSDDGNAFTERISSAEVGRMHDDVCGRSSDTEVCSSSAGSSHDADTGMRLPSIRSSSGEERSSPSGRAQGMALDDDDSAGEAEPAAMPANGWRPGKDSGRFDQFRTPLVQVILTNLYLNARRLPSELGKAILKFLLPREESAPRRNFADRLVALLAGVSQSRGRRTHDQVRDNGWAPCEDNNQDHVDEPSDAEPAFQFARGCATKEERSLWAMKVRVEEALHISRKGDADADYIRAMKRMRSHGLVLGKKYRSHHFVELVEEHCVAALRALTAQSLDQLMPSMGIPADLVLLFDGVSIGARMFSRYESMLLIGVVVMEETSPGQWSEVPHLLAAPSAGQMHTGPEQAELIMQSLADHPAHLQQAKLSSRLGLTGSDGAACAGGEDRIHNGTRAAEITWETVHPRADPSSPPAASATEWDLFHRLDRAVSKAIESTPAAVAIFDVARALGALFGVGDGRVILRATADAIGERRLRVPDQGGTRKIVALANTVEHLLKMHRTFHAAMHARLGQRQAGRGTQSLHKLLDVGRQISALDFMAFTIGAGDVLRTCIVPVALQAQQVSGSSRAMNLACRSTLEKLTKARFALRQLRFWCLASTLLCTRLSRSDLAALWQAVAFSELGRAFPKLALSLRQMLFAQEFGGCKLTVALPADHDHSGIKHYTLSPCCQCASMILHPGEGPRVTPVTVSKSREVGSPHWEIAVPEWVANSVYPKKEMLESRTQAFPVPRLVRVPLEERAPLQLQGVPRFRRGTAPCSCLVPPLLLHSSQEILQGLYELQCFIHRMLYYVEAYAVGSVGVNQHMRALTNAGVLSWDWEHLLRKPAGKDHYRAFFEIVNRFQPVLQKTQWPNSPEWQSA